MNRCVGLWLLLLTCTVTQPLYAIVDTPNHLPVKPQLEGTWPVFVTVG